MDADRSLIAQLWDRDILPTLEEFIRIPNQSPVFAPNWIEAGHMEQAVELAVNWVRTRRVPGLHVEVLRHPGRTPLVYLELAGQAPGTVLLYGHLDKQPPFEGWREGLGPWTPVLENGRLYGRGSADDGYAIFAIVAAIQALIASGRAFPRLVGIIECSEESGSPDLPAYVDALASRLGSPQLVVCLDSGCGDYERLWNTTSLRGLVGGDLSVEVLSEGVHSGDASGVVASSFRVMRILLDRLEDSQTGRILLDGLHVTVPPIRLAQARATAELLGARVHDHVPLVPGMRTMSDDLVELLLNRTWRPMLAVTAQGGMPPLEQGGNVLRPMTAFKLSLRIPPTLEPHQATSLVRETLTSDPPYGAKVRFHAEKSSAGWNAPEPAPWLAKALDDASIRHFGQPAANLGEGGSIPFMAMLGNRFPEAQFLVTGVLGPHSNAHGPNEFLHLATAKAVTACVADVLAAAARP